MQKRSLALDALRGIAILGMVFSSSITFGLLPSWMYHAQEPPPTHEFKPYLAGITWVDTVFPLFLFCMGAAIPLALKKMEVGNAQKSTFKVLILVLKRYFTLLLFSFVVFYASSYNLGTGLKECIVSLSMFVLLHLAFSHKLFQNLKINRIVKWLSVLTMLFFLCKYPFKQSFSLGRTDIILQILADMSLFSMLIGWLCRKHTNRMILLLFFLFCFFLSASSAKNWTTYLLERLSFSMVFSFSYLKYLYIVIPGIFAGNWLRRNETLFAPFSNVDLPRTKLIILIVLLMSTIVLNVVLLYLRLVFVDCMLTIVLLLFIRWLLVAQLLLDKFKQIFDWGSLLLIGGVILEPFEGGIKKDPATFSYLFVCAGLAFLMLLLLFSVELLQGRLLQWLQKLSLIGRNPMVAYVCGGLLLYPLLEIFHIKESFMAFTTNFWGGFVRGMIVTVTVAFITIAFTKRGWYWKS